MWWLQENGYTCFEKINSGASKQDNHIVTGDESWVKDEPMSFFPVFES